MGEGIGCWWEACWARASRLWGRTGARQPGAAAKSVGLPHAVASPLPPFPASWPFAQRAAAALLCSIEHPQALIDRLQYGEADAASKVLRGKGPYPVAEYRLAAEVSAAAAAAAAASAQPSRTAATDGSAGYLADDWYQPMLAGGGNDGSAEGGAAAAGAAGGSTGGGGAAARAVFSFCMCPGGQIVPTSSGEEELCINGMSFSRWSGSCGLCIVPAVLPITSRLQCRWVERVKSWPRLGSPTYLVFRPRPRRRDSKWANSALVVAVQPPDWQHLLAAHGPLAGVALQRRYEREAAARGGGCFVAPAQRVSDFLAARAPSGQLPASSYRLGVRGASLHDFYPPHWTAAFSLALQRFDRQLPGFARCSPEAGVAAGCPSSPQPSHPRLLPRARGFALLPWVPLSRKEHAAPPLRAPVCHKHSPPPLQRRGLVARRRDTHQRSRPSGEARRQPAEPLSARAVPLRRGGRLRRRHRVGGGGRAAGGRRCRCGADGAAAWRRGGRRLQARQGWLLTRGSEGPGCLCFTAAA